MYSIGVKINLSTILLFVHIINTILCGCPERELLYPCTCHHSIFGTHIYCGGDSHINLENIFDSLSVGLERDKKHFNHLTISNSAITHVNENAFRDITFESILFENCLNLSKINRNAFTETNWYTKSFAIKNCSKFDPNFEDFFYSLSKFKNLENLQIFDTNLTEIPSKAFKPINGYQNQLKTINISGKSLKKIGNNSFKYLFALKNLSLVNTSIDYIPDNAFTFMRASNIKIEINLNDNYFLNETSFSKNSFAYILRPTEIIGLKLNILSEEVFLPFLIGNTQNSMQMQNKSEILCNDCRNYWLRRNSELSLRIIGIKCSNGYNLMQNNNFINCIH